MGNVFSLSDHAKPVGIYRLFRGRKGVEIKDDGANMIGDVISIRNRSGVVVRRVVWDGFSHVDPSQWAQVFQEIQQEATRLKRSLASRKLYGELWTELGYGGSVICDPVAIGLRLKVGKRYAVELAVSSLRKDGMLILSHATDSGDAWRLNPRPEIIVDRKRKPSPAKAAVELSAYRESAA